MKIKEMYDTPRYPYHYLIELLDGSMKLFYMVPFRQITEKDLYPCIVATPKQIGAEPVQEYIRLLYGLKKEKEDE